MASEQAPVESPLPLSKYSKRVTLDSISSRPDGGVGLIGQRVVVGGWVKSSREFKAAAPPPAAGAPKDISCVEVLQTKLPFFRSIIKVFGGEQRIRDKIESVLPKPPQPSISILQISDGSCVSSLQVVVDSGLAPPAHIMATGTCILVEGLFQKPSLLEKEKYRIEVKADNILHIGSVDQDRYPLSKKRLPLELLRDSAHFRPRTTTVASVMRIRNGLTQAAHTFFQENGFLLVQVPVITATDCDGLGQSLVVAEAQERSRDAIKLDTIRASLKEKTKKIDQLKRNESDKEALAAAVQDLKKTAELASQVEAKQRGNKSLNFFPCKTYLSASGRLHLESYASALGNVCSFGPRFHASASQSKKLLAEMWMVEIEVAFSELQDSMQCAVDFLKFVCRRILESSAEDLKFMAKRVDKHVVDRLQLIAEGPFEKISYTEAVKVLKQGKFEGSIEWGAPLSEEHEFHLAEEVYKKPVIVYNHPKELKPFNARCNDDGETCAAFDVIVPKVGALIRGSQSEERFNMLSARMKELGLEKKQYEWYVDLRRHGAVKCSGFSFMFDPFVLYATGLNDVHDATPFPRSFGQLHN
ncbi:asparagine--tRNA ligase, cytoplasmic 2-like [Salvia miltiorrhiza]|uniref:asparagine--tRNA ligase, cytoplasmic 2-like n=1 Tax=Salvia miltiorrhiza TaxID=226208 RepID=UPI0025AB9960|nr:asparagine--tRNA ligase, cytoplasmic 2-like [Salvia miltiorrhiza]